MGEQAKERSSTARPRILDSSSPILSLNTDKSFTPKPSQGIEQLKEEALHVVGRLETILLEHRQAAMHMKVDLDKEAVMVVISALRDHAKGGQGEIRTYSDDEILTYCLQRLFDELVEEPSNILYTTKTGKNKVRYDAMEAQFWIECLNLLEESNLV